MLAKIREIVRPLIGFLGCSKKTLLLIAIVAISSVAVTTASSIMLSRIGNFTLPTLGTVKAVGVEVYWDQDLENRTETIDWDEIWVGSSKNVTVYVRSISNHQIFLNLDVRDWDPVAVSVYMDISWDYDKILLNPGETIPVTITLTIPSSHSFVSYLRENDLQNFKVDIHILAATE